MPTHPSHHDPDEGPIGTTRTRMPESGSASARRPPPRSSRTLVTVVGIVVLLIAALAFATRGSSSNGSATSSGGSTANGSAQGPQAAPTTPTGTRPVTADTAGIATGFPRTAQGAQSAAANYAVALGGDGMFNTARRHQIVGTVAAASAVGKLQSGFDASYSAAFLQHIGLNDDGSAPQGQTFVDRTIPAGTKITSYTADTATVSAWCMGLSGLAGNASTKPVTSSWFTVNFTLKWNGSDWKVLKAQQTKGPTPIAGDDPVSSADAIAGAVQGYGGFTYAR